VVHRAILKSACGPRAGARILTRCGNYLLTYLVTYLLSFALGLRLIGLCLPIEEGVLPSPPLQFRDESRSRNVSALSVVWEPPMLTEFQLWVLSATEIVALYVVCVMLLRAVIPGQIKWAPKCLAYGVLNRLAGVWGRAGCLNPTALLTAKLSPSGRRAAQRSQK
jgi:hypothetical protein